MKDTTLRWSVAIRHGLIDARARGKVNRANKPEAGEILSQLLMALGLVVLAVGIVAGLTLWANGKIGLLNQH